MSATASQRTPPDTASAFAPASVSNVACGFDVFGFAVEHLGDEVAARRTEEPGVVFSEISGDDGRLPREASRNTAGVAAQATLDRLAHHLDTAPSGVELSLRKRMPLSSGLGSSAASAVAAAVAVDALFGKVLTCAELLHCALAGERLASGSEHGDNLAPSLFGGFVLVRALRPVPDVVRLPVPEGLYCALVRPEIEVETHAARDLLGHQVELSRAVRQWANTGALVSALYSNDWALLGRSLEDSIAEPIRGGLVPGFREIKDAALESGALGSSLSGSGPTIFALCRGRDSAEQVRAAMAEAAHGTSGLPCDSWISVVGARGAHELSPEAVAGQGTPMTQ